MKKLWAWAVKAAKWSTGGTSSLYLYGGLLLAGAAAMLAVVSWHADQVDNHYEASFKAGRLEAESDQIREQQHELTRMVGVTNQLNGAYRAQMQDLATAEQRADAADERVRELLAKRKAAIAAAPAEAVRRYATVAGDVYAACRAEYRSLGLDAGRCSAAAHTLDSYATEVSRTQFSMPRSPFTKPVEKQP